MRQLYVIFSGLPSGDPTSCTFVELEDQDGNSVGKESGVSWTKRRGQEEDNLVALGPFYSAKEVREELMQGRGGDAL